MKSHILTGDMAMITTSYGANVSKKNVKGEFVDKVEEGVGFFFT